MICSTVVIEKNCNLQNLLLVTEVLVWKYYYLEKFSYKIPMPNSDPDYHCLLSRDIVGVGTQYLMGGGRRSVGELGFKVTLNLLI